MTTRLDLSATGAWGRTGSGLTIARRVITTRERALEPEEPALQGEGMENSLDVKATTVAGRTDLMVSIHIYISNEQVL